MYLGVLIEMAYFDEIGVGFLIVGHTHAPIDQKFSAMKSRIRNARFIGSPPSLWRLLGAASGAGFYEAREAESKYVTPAAQIKLSVVRDYKVALLPYFETSVSKYGIPYNFRLRCIGGVAVYQVMIAAD